VGVLVLGCWGNLTMPWLDYGVSLDISENLFWAIFSWRIFLFLGGGETLRIIECLGEFLKSFIYRNLLTLYAPKLAAPRSPCTVQNPLSALYGSLRITECCHDAENI